MTAAIRVTQRLENVCKCFSGDDEITSPAELFILRPLFAKWKLQHSVFLLMAFASLINERNLGLNREH